MEMKIKYGEHEVIITSINPTEERLEITASEDNVTFDILKELKGYQGEIKYYEDDVFIIDYTGYNVDFNCIYVGNTFTATLKRIGETQDKINELSETIDSLLFDVIPTLMGGL